MQPPQLLLERRFLKAYTKYYIAAYKQNNYTSKELNKSDDHKSKKKWDIKTNTIAIDLQTFHRMNLIATVSSVSVRCQVQRKILRVTKGPWLKFQRKNETVQWNIEMLKHRKPLLLILITVMWWVRSEVHLLGKRQKRTTPRRGLRQFRKKPHLLKLWKRTKTPPLKPPNRTQTMKLIKIHCTTSKAIKRNISPLNPSSTPPNSSSSKRENKVSPDYQQYKAIWIENLTK